jgi:trehalose-phosphatase
MNRQPFKAAIVDLDGVITRTASLHGQAWKQMFDRFLDQRAEHAGEHHAPFDLEQDYLPYIDGKPRFDGVRSFLASRDIELPEGSPEDPPGTETVYGLGKRKNDIFLELLKQQGVATFDDAVEQVRRWQSEGLRTAVITSSRNGRRILAAAGLQDLFAVVVDGNDAERLAIAGKPAPDVFLHAARELGVRPEEAMVVEDAISGIEAGRAGGFGLVVGLARNGHAALEQANADLVVSDLREMDAQWSPADRRAGAGPANALAHLDELTSHLDAKRLVLFFDYDGTLTPIVRRAEEATLTDAMRSLLRELARYVTVAIISGRDLADVQKMVQLDELYYAGSHGYDVAGPGGLRMQQDQAQDHLPELDAARRELEVRLEALGGAWVEQKRFAVAIHFREAAASDEPRIERAVNEVRAAHPRLRKKGGKKIFELQPDVAWDKGRAVHWLLEQLELKRPDVIPVYVGDDVTDEDAFQALPDPGFGIRVGSPDEPTHAAFYLRDSDELEQFIRDLLAQLKESEQERD